MKTLQGAKDTKIAAAQWHVDVFREYGYVCWLHKAKDPRSKVSATEAAHIIKRSRMGAALAYVSVRLGRPLCQPCHRSQEPGTDPLFRFPFVDLLDATKAHNEFAKVHFTHPDAYENAWE